MMTKTRAAASQYLQSQIQASSPLELVVMLYDGAIRAADAAADAMIRGDIPARKVAMSKLIAIIGELQSTLNLEQGGKIAADLDRLYSWATARLLDAIVERDVRPIEEVRRVLDSLREAWQTIASAPAGSARP
jgi:flagellar secretion chaperone FliS